MLPVVKAEKDGYTETLSEQELCMLTEQEFQVILDFDWTGVDLRELIQRVRNGNEVTEALSAFTMTPKEQLLSKIFKKMSDDDIGVLETRLYAGTNDVAMNDIFIIHSDSDNELAVSIENELKSIFGSAIKVFNSSNPYGIKGGNEWFNFVTSQHRRSKIGLVLITENAVNNLWVHFEAGGFFLRENTPAIPLFLNSEALRELPFPLKGIQGKKLWEKPFRESLVNQIAQALGNRDYSYDDDRFCTNVLHNNTARAKSAKEILGEIESYHNARIGDILAERTILSIASGPRLILHVVPIDSLGKSLKFDVKDSDLFVKCLPPIGVVGWNYKFNLDGIVTFANGSNTDGRVACYSQFYRTGQVEAIATNVAREYQGRHQLPSKAYEKWILQAAFKYVQLLQALEVKCPIGICVDLLGVKGIWMGVDSFFLGEGGSAIDRDNLILEPILINDCTLVVNIIDMAKILRPIFDLIWNSCGFSHSYNYDENGNWIP